MTNTRSAQIILIILTLNQRQKTLTCLDSLAKLAQDPPFQIMVWDNGSDDDTAEAIQAQYPKVMIHCHSQNLGVAGGRNAAAQMVIETYHPEYLLFLDNDMLVEPNFVRALWQPFQTDAYVGQTQAKLRFMYDRQRLNDGGGCRINFLFGQTMPVGYDELDRGQYDQIKPCVACGGAMMVRSDVFQALEGFDLKFNPFGPEDLDFSLRLTKAGYKALYIPQAMAYHEVSHTFGEGYSENYARHKARHWFLFMRRHASLWQKLGFFSIGAPILALRIIIREGKRGNFGALRGLVRGIADFIKSSKTPSS